MFFRLYVNRDTLFSFHKASEAFLHSLMSIYVSAHYKNTPNDLQVSFIGSVSKITVIFLPYFIFRCFLTLLHIIFLF